MIHAFGTIDHTRLHTRAPWQILVSFMRTYSYKCRCTYKGLHTFTQNIFTPTNTDPLVQTKLQGESEQSGHPNYGVLYGKLVRYSRKTVIKTSDSGVLWWSGSLHVRLIWRHETANSWPLNAACTSCEVSPVQFCLCACSYWEEHCRGLALPTGIGNRIIILRIWSGRCSAAWHNCLTCL